MKKFLTFLFVCLLGLSLVSCGNNEQPTPTPNPNPNPDPIVPNPEPKPEGLTKHLILDDFGNYGGTVNKSKYGIGAPFNGLYDNKDTEYYMINDFYNMKSNSKRMIFPKFSPYQQTMQDSSGIACVLMGLNYYGEDIRNEFNEVQLVDKYEKLSGEKVFKHGTTKEGLAALINEIGYTATAYSYDDSGKDQTTNMGNLSEIIQTNIAAGNMMMVQWQDGFDTLWHLIIGIDTNDTDTPRDDTVIFADPYDNLDHFQDGYSMEALSRLFRWWFNVLPSGNITNKMEYVVMEAKEPIVFDIDESVADEQQVLPEKHLILNPDGSYGGTTNADRYGNGTTANGITDVPTSIYHKFVDYYNMTSTETRTILPHYRGYQQTMASSCGICSMLSVLTYYGIDTTVYNEEWLCAKYCEVNNKETIYNVGVGSGGLAKMVATFGFNADYDSYSKSSFIDPETSMCFPTFESFKDFLHGRLIKGSPLPVCFRPHNGHWETIMGYDDMGTSYLYDDVIILADSWDTWDHYQDGYNTYPAHMFYRQWYNGGFTYNQQYVTYDNIKK